MRVRVAYGGVQVAGGRLVACKRERGERASENKVSACEDATDERRPG
jgi:hypothetical protein